MQTRVRDCWTSVLSPRSPVAWSACARWRACLLNFMKTGDCGCGVEIVIEGGSTSGPVADLRTASRRPRHAVVDDCVPSWRTARTVWWCRLDRRIFLLADLCVFVSRFVTFEYVRGCCRLAGTGHRAVNRFCEIRQRSTQPCSWWSVSRVWKADNYTLCPEKSNPLCTFYNSGNWCRILTKFCINNAASNCKQTAKFQ